VFLPDHGLLLDLLVLFILLLYGRLYAWPFHSNYLFLYRCQRLVLLPDFRHIHVRTSLLFFFVFFVVYGFRSESVMLGFCDLGRRRVFDRSLRVGCAISFNFDRCCRPSFWRGFPNELVGLPELLDLSSNVLALLQEVLSLDDEGETELSDVV